MNPSIVQPAGNFYDKYHTRNPIARALMQGFLRSFEELLGKAGMPARALEIGCGEAELSMRMARNGWQVQGCDIAPEAIDEAMKRVQAAGLDIPLAVHDIRDAPSHYEPAELVVCCEVLEHLEDTEAALEILARLTTRHLLVSVPREPIWRVMNLARGRYVRQWGNTPGHIQHWSRHGFAELLTRRFDVQEVRTPLPWTMALCRVRS